MSSSLIDSNSIALLTLGINYPGIFVKPSVGSTNDGQSEVFFVPLKTEGIYEKLVEDVKRKKITGSVQVLFIFMLIDRFRLKLLANLTKRTSILFV